MVVSTATVEPRSRDKGQGLPDHGCGWASWAIHGRFKKLSDYREGRLPGVDDRNLREDY